MVKLTQRVLVSHGKRSEQVVVVINLSLVQSFEIMMLAQSVFCVNSKSVNSLI